MIKTLSLQSSPLRRSEEKLLLHAYQVLLVSRKKNNRMIHSSLHSPIIGPSFVQVASKNLDHAAPSAQSKVDALPTFDEHDMMAASARRETRVKKQWDNADQHSDGKTFLRLRSPL